MPILQYQPEEKERFKAYSTVMFGCREVCRRLLEETSGLQSASGSLADRDSRQLGALQPSTLHGTPDVILGGTVGPHVYAAGEYLGAMSALYAAEEVHLAPIVLARTLIEHCAHAIWILGARDDPAESRLARALLDLLNGLEQTEIYAKQFRGAGSPEHMAEKAHTAAVRNAAHAIFAPPYKLDDVHGRKRPALGLELLPGSAAIVAQAVRLMSSSLDEKQALGTYALLSTSVHATPNEIANLTSASDPNDPTSVRLTRNLTTHEPLVRMLVAFFYSALSHALSYVGVKGQLHHDLGDVIETYLPGHFGKGPEPGPFDN